MKNKKNILGLLMLLACSSAAFGQLTILSGSKQATQYSFIQDIATIFANPDFKIVNKETNGVSDNFNQLVDPNSPYKLAVIQADFLYYAQAQDMRLNTETTKNLKVVVPLGYQQIHLVTKASKGYKGLQDVQGTVAIGDANQGTYTTAMLMEERSKGKWTAMNTQFEECFRELALDKIDAFFIVSSAPIAKLDLNPQGMTDKLTLVPLENYNDWARYYKPDTIRKAEYQWLDHDVPTYSVPTVLVVNESKLSGEERKQVAQLKSGIQSKLGQLKASGHAQWKQVNLRDWNESNWPLFK